MERTVRQQEQLQYRVRIAQQHTLQQPDLLQAEILANVSHELRSPLAAIKGYTSTLLHHDQQVTPEERQAFLLAIQEAGDRMNTVVDRLLRISQLETGNSTFHLAPLNLVSLVQEALLAAKQRLDGLRTTRKPLPRFRFWLKNTLTEDEVIIQADRALLHEALDQVLDNAIQYSPAGGQVSVLLRPFSPTSPASSLTAQVPLVEICITDQGMGIPQEHLGLIFDRFTRSDTSLTRETSGLGLGLTMCKWIVELHQGSIWAESTPGQGSTFHLVFPGESLTSATNTEMPRS